MKDLEQNIIQLLQARDKKAISILYDHYAPALYGVVLRIVRSEEIAEDVMQDTFVKIWKKSHQFNLQKGSLFTWVLNVARNTAIDQTRSASFKRRTQIQELDSFVYNNKSLSEEWNPDHIGLRKQVEQLDEKYKKVIDLVYFNGYTQKEVSEHLQIPLGSVKSRVRIALRELRKVFDGSGIILTLGWFFRSIF